jgi:hypothetical protein
VRSSTDAVGAGRAQPSYVEFTVERSLGGVWEIVAGVVTAGSAAHAVTLVCTDEGLYRARRTGTTGPHEHFAVPAWGPPEPVEPGLT